MIEMLLLIFLATCLFFEIARIKERDAWQKERKDLINRIQARHTQEYVQITKLDRPRPTNDKPREEEHYFV